MFGLAVIVLASCVTSVPIEVTNLPSMDTSGINRLAVMPFGTAGHGPNQRQIAGALTTIATEAIAGAHYFTLVDPGEITRRESAGMGYADAVDAVFRGDVVALSVDDSSHSEEYIETTRDGKKIKRSKTIYDRSVVLDFTYRLVRARDGTVIGQRHRTATGTNHSETRRDLESGFTLARRAAERELSGLAREVAPWKSVVRRTLEKETSKDKALKARMKEAEALVKGGSYRSAKDAFGQIYRETGSFAAGYNEAVMAEALGELDESISLMTALGESTGNQKALAAAARLAVIKRDNQTLAEKFTGKSAEDTVAAQAAAELIAALPQKAAVSLFNTSRTDTGLADRVIDEMAAALMDAGTFTLLDRRNLALINAEKRYQASGEVSDESFVDIGHMLGVEIIVTVSITGSGSRRHLSVTATTVETGEILCQSFLEI